MEKQSFISGGQVVALLIMTRLPFSTAYIVSLQAGRSVQDILFAVPVNFLINFIVAIPFLLLFRRYPGRDPVECAFNILGKPGGAAVALIYALFFLGSAVETQLLLQDFFVSCIIPTANFYAIVIPMLLVCLYGAVRGIEAIARYGSLTIAVYLLTIAVITLTLLSTMDIKYLFPMFYNGPRVFLKAVLAGFNSNPQILYLAFCLPFLKSGAKPGRLFAKWNILAMLLFWALEFDIVVVMGPYGAKQKYPLYTLSQQSKISVFERLDAIDMVSWLLNAALFTAFFLYFFTNCIVKLGLNRHRKLIACIAAVLILILADLLIKSPFEAFRRFTSPLMSVVTIILLTVIPLFLLIADVIKRRLADEKAN